MKLKIYKNDLSPPIIVECETWNLSFENVARLKCVAGNRYVAEFNFNNIAGFTEEKE